MPIPLLVILAILLFLLLLLTLRVRLVITCREAVTLRLSVLFVTVTLFPRSAKRIKPRRYTWKNVKRRQSRAEKKAARKAQRAEKKAAKKAAQKAAREKALREGHTPPKPPTLRENIALVRALVAALIRKTGKHLRLQTARLNIRVATGDAATTAILYGAVSAALAYLLAALDRVVDLKTKPREMSVFADYLAERSSADIKLVFSIRTFGALVLLTSVVLAFIKTKHAQRAARRTAKQDDRPQKQ